MRAKMRAGGAPWRPSLKVARLEDDTGTSLDDHLPRAPVVSDWQRRDGGGATRVRRCPEGDSGSQRPLNRAPSADEMTASSRRTRWRHRRELATRAFVAHGCFLFFVFFVLFTVIQQHAEHSRCPPGENPASDSMRAGSRSHLPSTELHQAPP